MKSVVEKRGAQGVSFVAVLWLLCQPALAGSVCVSCDGPPAVYSCSYAPDANGNVPGSGRALQFACIQDVARRYQHATCSVNRNHLGPCNGQVHMMSPGAASQAASQPSGNAAPDQGAGPLPAPVPPVAPAKGGKREPKTVVELAKRTADNTKKQIKKSARTVSKAARSTWRCVSTLFSKC